MYRFQLVEKSENSMVNLQWMRKHNELCDVVLIYEGVKYFAHSCILSSQSPVLAGLIQARLASQNEWSILKPLMIIINGRDTDENVHSPNIADDKEETNGLELLLSFLYGDVITVDESNFQELIKISKSLGLLQHFKSNKSEINIVKGDKNKRKTNLNSSINNKDQKLKSCSKELSSNHKENCKNSTKDDSIVHQNVNANDLSTQSSEQITSLKDNDAAEAIKLKSNKIHDSSIVLSDNDYWFENEIMNPLENKAISRMGFSHVVCEEVEDSTAPNRKPLYYEEPAPLQRKMNKAGIFCEICSALFHRVTDIITHIKYENHFSAVCPICYLQLNEYKDQRNHFLQHDHPLPFFCNSCDLRFRSRAALSMHTPKHSNAKPYSCDECGRAFKWRHAAQAHAITHKKHCHLLCDMCGFSSKYMTTFKSHLKRHYDQYFPCPHPGCNFKSFRKTHLNDHIITHSKLRPHQCDVCGYSFSQAKNLRRHMRLHAPASSLLKCSNGTCNFTTTRLDKLKAHLFKKHNVSNYKSTSTISSNIAKKIDDVDAISTTKEPRSYSLKDIKEENKLTVSRIKPSDNTATVEENFLNDILSSKCNKIDQGSISIIIKAEEFVGESHSQSIKQDHNVSSSYETYFIQNSLNSENQFENAERIVLLEDMVVGSPNCVSMSNFSALSRDANEDCSMIDDSVSIDLGMEKNISYLPDENKHLDEAFQCSNVMPNDFHDSSRRSTQQAPLQEHNYELIGYLPASESQASSVSVVMEDSIMLENDLDSFADEHNQIEIPSSTIPPPSYQTLQTKDASNQKESSANSESTDETSAEEFQISVAIKNSQQFEPSFSITENY